MEILNDIVTVANDILWSYLLMALLLACALLFTIKSRFVQFRLIGEMFRLIVKPAKPTKKTGKHVSSLQAFIVSLAGRVGTGNLAGVATALAIGGAGSVFWMWVTALLGSAISFFECTLAQLYKTRNGEGFIGGPAYYMQFGSHQKKLAVFFALLSAVCFGVAYNSVHSNTICAACQESFHLSPFYLGIFLSVGTLCIIFGGLHRIIKVSSVIVPIMASIYIFIALAVVLMNLNLIPAILKQIMEQAFSIHAVVGGGLGAAMTQGIRRGLYSNEAGMGTSPNVAATAHVSHPVKQGLIQAFGVFVDTLIICSCTAFIILLSPVALDGDANGIQLTQRALSEQIGSYGSLFIACTVLMFAFSTILSNYYYGETNLRFFTSNAKVLFVYRILACCVVFFGSVASLELTWNLADLAMGLMTLCNVVSMVLLVKPVVLLLKHYEKQREEKKDPQFQKGDIPELPGEITCW